MSLQYPIYSWLQPSSFFFPFFHQGHKFLLRYYLHAISSPHTDSLTIITQYYIPNYIYSEVLTKSIFTTGTVQISVLMEHHFSLISLCKSVDFDPARLPLLPCMTNSAPNTPGQPFPSPFLQGLLFTFLPILMYLPSINQNMGPSQPQAVPPFFPLSENGDFPYSFGSQVIRICS